MDEALPVQAQIEAEIRTLARQRGFSISQQDFPGLALLASRSELRGPDGDHIGVADLVDQAIERMEPGPNRQAAWILYSKEALWSDMNLTGRRISAAPVLGLAVETLRKHHEPVLRDQLADQLLALAGGQAAKPTSGDALSRRRTLAQTIMRHRLSVLTFVAGVLVGIAGSTALT